MSKRGIHLYVCYQNLGPGQTAKSLAEAARRSAGDTDVEVQTVPCSGKTDVVYMLRAFEGGARGVGLITCPPGKCRNFEGNIRAMVRIAHAAQLLDEVGVGGQRLVISHLAESAQGADLESLVAQTVKRLAALPPNPVVRPAEPAQVEQK